MRKQLFICNQDRDRIYPLVKEFIHITVTVFDDVPYIQIKIAGLLLGVANSIKQANRIKRMITNFDGRNGQIFHMPGYCNYNSKSDWMELLAMYHRFEEMEAVIDEMS